MDFPEPVISVAVEPKSKGDQQKMSNAIVRLAAEDPSFKYKRDEESGQTIISGMGELHLEIIVDRMQREFNVNCEVGAPQVTARHVDCVQFIRLIADSSARTALVLLPSLVPFGRRSDRLVSRHL